MSEALDPNFVSRYARPPSRSTVKRAISLHENVRAVLGEADYLTFLQGSYKNDTALADMNDVDIVVVVRRIKRGFLFGDYNWSTIFKAIEQRLEGDLRYAGKWKRHDKCITLDTDVNIDIVPAIHINNPEEDPIKIYSFSGSSEKNNWPRLHYKNAAAKNERTDGNFKPSVRLFKRWVRCHFRKERVAPSFYVECLIQSLPDQLFTGDPARGFVALGRELCKQHDGGAFDKLYSIAGNIELLNSAEWSRDLFRKFRAQLEQSLCYAERALEETSSTEAKAAWRYAFAGYNP